MKQQNNLKNEPIKEDKNMLNYIKIILDKVSFDKHLFEKELKKAQKSLLPSEFKQLCDWCVERFGRDFLQT
jgi:hypothetical protein